MFERSSALKKLSVWDKEAMIYLFFFKSNSANVLVANSIIQASEASVFWYVISFQIRVQD